MTKQFLASLNVEAISESFNVPRDSISDKNNALVLLIADSSPFSKKFYQIFDIIYD